MLQFLNWTAGQFLPPHGPEPGLLNRHRTLEECDRMTEPDLFTAQFQAQRAHLRAIAYRMLGSLGEAEDAVQDTWLRASRADREHINNLTAWLTTIVARVSLNALRSRARLREDPLEYFMPDPILSRADGSGTGQAMGPEEQAILTDNVGLALQVVLETLDPDERLAFVLHDLFQVPFNELAPIIERTPDAARKVASRARNRVRGQAPLPDPDLAGQRQVVDAFFAAARNGDFEALVAILHPDAEFRASGLTAQPLVLRGGTTVASNARMFGPDSLPYQHILVNGAAGVITVKDGQLQSITGFTVAGGRIVSIDVLAGASRLAALNPAIAD